VAVTGYRLPVLILDRRIAGMLNLSTGLQRS
jgi:hypothetical protein